MRKSWNDVLDELGCVFMKGFVVCVYCMGVVIGVFVGEFMFVC